MSRQDRLRELAVRKDADSAAYRREAELQPWRADHLRAKAEEYRESAAWYRHQADFEAGAS